MDENGVRGDRLHDGDAGGEVHEDLGVGQLTSDGPTDALVALDDAPPTELPAVILKDLVAFPGPVLPVILDTPARREAVLFARDHQGYVALVNLRSISDAMEEGRESGDVAASMAIADVLSEAQDDHGTLDGDENEGDVLDGDEGVALGELSEVAVLAKLVRVLQLPDGRMSALVEARSRVRLVELTQRDPFRRVRVVHVSDIEPKSSDKGSQAVYRQVRSTLRIFFKEHPGIPDELKMMGMQVNTPAALSDFVGQHLCRSFDERLEFLNELKVTKRLKMALEVSIRELDLLTIGNRISDEIRDRVEKTQREFFLREQLKAIRKELGEEKDPASLAVEDLRASLEAAQLPEEARERAEDELRRLSLIPSESPEHGVIRTYLEWIAALPWGDPSEEEMDIARAREILDEDHYGLEEVKDRIIEFLAVRKLNPNRPGGLLCFAGPPGVGKTSLGQSIARALGREFYRFSVGGMRDEAEIKGHRRTYIGAMPGRILQAMKQVKTPNPVIMLDELDKMGGDRRGDPSAAMLEVLDPAQNGAFLDHYLDIPFDLSNVMFVATANVKSAIPGPLLDRLEVVDLPGYIPEEKVEIASRHLVRRQRKEHGLPAKEFKVGKTTLRDMVRGYTHEAGVRELNRLVGKLARKRATEVVQGKKYDASIKADALVQYLGPRKLFDETLVARHRPGVAVGLAWTPAGGDVLMIEAVTMRGKGALKVTGQLGDVMGESAKIALSFVRSREEDLEVDAKAFDKKDIHLHFPAGAVPKDGPSAGVTITSALLSLLWNRPLKARVAMTGEITLRGEVLPVGGIREKVVAAKRAGVRTVIIPAKNKADVEEIPAPVLKGLRFVFADRYEDVQAAVF